MHNQHKFVTYINKNCTTYWILFVFILLSIQNTSCIAASIEAITNNYYRDNSRNSEVCQEILSRLGQTVTDMSSRITASSANRSEHGTIPPSIAFAAERKIAIGMNGIEHRFEKLRSAVPVSVDDCRSYAELAVFVFSEFINTVLLTNTIPELPIDGRGFIGKHQK